MNPLKLLLITILCIGLFTSPAKSAQEEPASYKLVSLMSGEGPECKCACGPYGYVKVAGNSVWAVYYKDNKRKVIKFGKSGVTISFKPNGIPSVTIQNGQVTAMEATDDLRACLGG